MRVVFFGTSEFGIPALRTLRDHSNLLAVVTTREAPKGRGLTLQASPVRAWAQAAGIPVLEPENPNAREFVAQLAEFEPELVVLAAYRFILKPEVLAVPVRGCLNLHPSLLPRYRGAATIQRAVMNGETRTGVSLFLMNEKIDQGDVIMQSEVDIGPNENSGELSDRLAILSASMLEQALPRIEHGDFARLPQDPAESSYAAKIRKEERLIDWQLSARRIHNLVRGLAPLPGAYTFLRRRRLEVMATEPDEARQGDPGRLAVVEKRLFCGAGKGSLALLKVKPEGGRLMNGVDFANGQRLKPGELLGDLE